MAEEVLTKNVKKLVHLGKGMVVFVTPEAKKFKWSDKDHVVVTAVQDEQDEKIVIRKLKF